MRKSNVIVVVEKPAPIKAVYDTLICDHCGVEYILSTVLRGYYLPLGATLAPPPKNPHCPYCGYHSEND